MTFFYKRVFPALWFGIILIVFAGSLYSAFEGKRAPQLPFLVVPAFMLLVGYLVMRSMIFGLADQVWDIGDALIVRYKGREERVSLSDVMNISYSGLANPQRATLTLRAGDGSLREISFLPPIRIASFARSPIIDDLIKRIDAARRGPRAS